MRDRPDPDDDVASAIGRLMAFWGFRRNLGRVWSLLFLSPEPMTVADLCSRLSLSGGSVAVALEELQRWGAVHRTLPAGDRREHYLAEPDIWKPIARVMEQREVREVDAVISALRRAEDSILRLDGGESDPAVEGARQFRRGRIRELRDIALAGRDMLGLALGRGEQDDALAQTAGPEPAAAPSRIRIPRAPADD